MPEQQYQHATFSSTGAEIANHASARDTSIELFGTMDRTVRLLNENHVMGIDEGDHNLLGTKSTVVGITLGAKERLGVPSGNPAPS